MSEALDATSSIDTTLPEHIASPPRSRNSSFATGAFAGAGVNTGPLPRNRTKSFVELSDVPTMAELGIDPDVIRDETDVTALPPSRSRRQSATADEYAGLDDSELRQRTMSSWMTIASNLDTTLIECVFLGGLALFSLADDPPSDLEILRPLPWWTRLTMRLRPSHILCITDELAWPPHMSLKCPCLDKCLVTAACNRCTPRYLLFDRRIPFICLSSMPRSSLRPHTQGFLNYC
jgi:hypothetical protein